MRNAIPAVIICFTYLINFAHDEIRNEFNQIERTYTSKVLRSLAAFQTLAAVNRVHDLDMHTIKYKKFYRFLRFRQMEVS